VPGSKCIIAANGVLKPGVKKNAGKEEKLEKKLWHLNNL